MWLQFSSLLCLVVGLYGQCCPPLQYEVTEDVFTTQYKGQSMNVNRGRRRLSYDAMNKRTAIYGTDYTTNTSSAFVVDYKQGKQYFWTGSNCQVWPAPPFNETCVPIGAKYLGSTVMGKAPHTIPVDQFSFEKDNNTLYASLGPDCTPVEGHQAGTYPNDGGGFSEFIVYSEFSLGIQNESVFTVPDFCTNQPVPINYGGSFDVERVLLIFGLLSTLNVYFDFIL